MKFKHGDMVEVEGYLGEVTKVTESYIEVLYGGEALHYCIEKYDINDIGGSKTVHKFENIIGNKVHPTEKPIDLMEFYVKNSSNEGDVVLDMFMGSCSAGVAALNTNRKFIGVEMEEKYFDIGASRMQESTIKGEIK